MSFSRFVSIGNYQSHSINGQYLLIEGDNGKLRICLASPFTVQVQAVRKGEDWADFSYAALPFEKQAITIEETDNTLSFFTGYYKVEIHKTPLRVRFYTQDGILINEDEPSFGIGWIGEEVTCYKTLQQGERFLGLGEKAGNLDKLNTQLTNWNTDAFAYGAESDPLYASIPFYIGIAHGHSYGIFLDNSAKTDFNFGASNHRFSFFRAQSGALNYYFFHAPDMSGVINAYTTLTGKIEMPPLWSLGYQQCRYSYYPAAEVLSLARTFREKNIPCDVLYLDIHYMQDYKVFTWNNQRFENPKQLINELNDMGFKVVVIVDPGIKIEDGYGIYEEGLKEGIFIKYPDGDTYRGEAWPGWCHFPDFTDGKARQWWGDKFEPLVGDGLEGFWNDMNEPAVWGKNVPDLVEFEYDGLKASHKQAHNVYGMQMARATHDGAKKYLHGKRPFVLTRAGYAGIQRFAALWTGDNVSTEEHLLLGARMISGLGLSGVPYAGFDVGGFIGEASPDLFTRWIQLGAFTPFFRGHTMINSRDAEPWAFGEEAEEISRNYIALRYRMMPYLYSLFYQASQTGMPVVRSLALNHHTEWKVFAYDYQNQFYFGDSLLVCPVVPNKQLTKVYLPQGEFYDFFNDEKVLQTGETIIELTKDKLPVFVKAGAILPMQATVQHTSQTTDILEIHLYYGQHETSFEYYEDDGQTYQYQNGGFYKRSLVYNPHQHSFTLGKKEGSYTSKYKTVRLFVHCFETDILKPSINGQAQTLSATDYRFVEPISNFDPWFKEIDSSKTIKDLPFIEFEHADNEVIINLI